MFVILEGNIYDPADIAIVNRSNGVDENELTDKVIDEVIASFAGFTKQNALDKFGGIP